MPKMDSDTEQEECSLEDVQEEMELALGDGEYLLSIFVSPGETLSIELERKVDGAMWRGDFTARYLEEVSKRAGNYKNFLNFVKMLHSAMTPSRCCSPTSSLQVDVLTHRDLIKALKIPNAINKDVHLLSPGSVSNIEKRYLILTYSNEFDLVHYSLPLLHEESFSELNGMKLCIKRLRQRVSYMKARLQKYEASPNIFPKQPKCLSSSNESKVYSDSDTSSDSRFSDSRTCRIQMTEIRALNKKVEGLEDKLRLERMSLNKTITILSRRNTALEEDAKKAKERELRLCNKLSNSNFQMSLLRGKGKPHGIMPPRSASPSRCTPGMELNLRPDSAPSLRRNYGYTSSQAYGALPKGSFVNRALQSPYASPPYNFLENRKNCSPNSKNIWRQASPSSLPKYGKMSPNGDHSLPPKKASTPSFPPLRPYGQGGKFMDQEASSGHGREYRHPFFVPPPSTLGDPRRKTSPFPSPPSSPSQFTQRPKVSSTQSSPRCRAPLLPSRSPMSSPRSTRRPPPQSSVPRLTRSQSCPILSVREEGKPDFYTRRTRPRPRPRPYSPTPDLAVLQDIKVMAQEEITHQNSSKSTRRIVDGVTSQVGKIDSRLYALQDYLHRMHLDRRGERL